ncbi:hypothetical protein MG293_000713 [Ovis ammon polii]|uniref:Uncharacterized protein n=1 Tax=Ovis ammon polii TaxID=230172 RepID=A0AAD4YHK0_OVIAM|nr:hypothetical protein MG293_000713 [Ovis ammon polii]
MAPHSSTLAWKIPWTEEPVEKENTTEDRKTLFDFVTEEKCYMKILSDKLSDMGLPVRSVDFNRGTDNITVRQGDTAILRYICNYNSDSHNRGSCGTVLTIDNIQV